MVMKRYPHGAAGDFFFMKRAPSPRPDWIETIAIDHGSGSVIDFPMVQDLASLMWCINLGCIDLNQWYARCDDVDRPDYVHFDLDPGDGAALRAVRETALILDETLRGLGMPTFAKTSGSKGIHVYVPIKRGPSRSRSGRFAKTVSVEVARRYPKLMTAVYVRAKRPRRPRARRLQPEPLGRDAGVDLFGAPDAGRVGVDAGHVEGVAPKVEIADFTLHNVPARLKRKGDLWAPVASDEDDPIRFDLAKFNLSTKR